MQLLEQRILADGEVKSSEILKVDRFLNHQMDPKLFLAMAEEWKRLFDGCGVNKLVTIEASGIGIAAVAGLVFDCPVVFAKKTKSRNVSDDAYTTVVHSFTHGNDNTIRISREYLSARDRVLVIDDFLANARRAHHAHRERGGDRGRRGHRGGKGVPARRCAHPRARLPRGVARPRAEHGPGDRHRVLLTGLCKSTG